MFEHLDDPSPPEPSLRTLGAVIEHSARLRRRRTISATGATVVLALSTGLVAGVLLDRSPAPAFTDFSARAGVTAGTEVPSSDLADVVFVSDTIGFALATHDMRTALVESTDGGDSWLVVQGNLPTSYPAQILFADPTHGYLWGGAPSADGALPLWVSTDGGRDWAEAPIGPVVSDVSAIGADVWAVVGSCFIGVSEPASSCPVTLEESSNDGTTWTSSETAPPVSESSSISMSDQDVELARMTLGRAYVLSFDPSSDGSAISSGQLVYTADGGAVWQRRIDPCPGEFDFGEQVAGSATSDLWLLCASQASAGTQAKALYRSSDGGLAWTLVAAANAPVLTGGVVLPAVGELTVGGYVSPYSLGHENLAVLSSSTAWLFPDRSDVLETTNGGLDWGSVNALENTGLAGQGTGNVVFVNLTHGWVSESGVGLWRTTDGVKWQRLGS